MAHFKIFAQAKKFLIDLNDGDGEKLVGFYTGRCIEASTESRAQEIFKNEIMKDLETNYNYRPSEYDASEIIIEELELIECFDDRYNIGNAFYEEDEIQ